MSNLIRPTILMCVATAIVSPAQTFETLASFNPNGGSDPRYVTLVQGIDGYLYGTTAGGGLHGWGAIFKISTGGALMTVHSFYFYGSGGSPGVGMVQGIDGAFYGTAYQGGANGYGAVFRMAPDGKVTTLHSLRPADGASPGALVRARNGNLYGTTYGAYDCCIANKNGSVFEVAPAGTMTTLHSFNVTDGAEPVGQLVLTSGGELYGMEQP